MFEVVVKIMYEWQRGVRRITKLLLNQANGDEQKRQSRVKVPAIEAEAAEGHRQRIGTLSLVTSTTRIYHGKSEWIEKKKRLEGFPHVFVNPFPNP